MMNSTTDYMSSTSLNLSSILGVTLTTAMIAVVVARLFIRTSDGRRSIRLVDWTHLLACLFSIAVSVTAVIGVWYCFGHRELDISVSDTINGLKYYWISRILYIVATWVVKIAVLVTLLLANSPPQQVRKFLEALLYGVMVFTTVYTALFWVGAMTECRPTRGIYDKRGILDGQCFPRNVVRGMAIGYAIVNAATDLFLVLLSIFVVYGMRRSMREKVALGVVFMLAFVATGAAGVHAFCEFGYGKPGNLIHDKNNFAIWAIVEINIGLIAVNLPGLSPLFRSLLRPQDSPTQDPNPHPRSPTISPSTTPDMTTVHKDDLEYSDVPLYLPPVRPVPPFAMQSMQRYSSDSKSTFSEIMTMQLDADIGNHPIFRDQGNPGPWTGVGHRRTQTPLIF